jgi:hypothetical protein
MGVLCGQDGPLVYGDHGLLQRYTGGAWQDLSEPGLDTVFTCGALAADTVFLAGITHMSMPEFLGFPQFVSPTTNGWDNTTIEWQPIHNPDPSFCQGLLSQPGVWTFWVILSGPDTFKIRLPDLERLADYPLIPAGSKTLNLTCGRKSGFDFNNFSRYDTSMYRMPSYSVNMLRF